MKRILIPLMMLCTSMGIQAEEFTGDVKLACEAVLCLSSGSAPSQCSPSLSRYFSISHRKLSDTIQGRINFLNLCPTASYDSNMQKLINDIGHGAGRCDPNSLNSTLRYNYGCSDNGCDTQIANTLPDYCTSYVNNGYTDLKRTQAQYVGIPERGGYWVEPTQYVNALKAYNERVAQEDEQRRQQSYQ